MLRRTAPAIRAALIGAVAAFAPLASVAAQADDTSRVRAGGGDSSNVDSLVARAVVANPAIGAAAARLAAARARVAPAGLLPDPMLMVGVQNLPLGRMQSAAAGHGEAAGSGPDPMTTKMVGVGQTVPYPGKLAARKRVAERGVEAAEAALAATTRQVIQDVRRA
jgi:cobalt-zinc-cadmium efflux system outer membrane protein